MLSMPPKLTDYELETAARACRALAYRETEDAKKLENPGMRGAVEQRARTAAALAERFERARKLRTHGRVVNPGRGHS